VGYIGPVKVGEKGSAGKHALALATAAAVLVILLLIGCGGGNQPDQPARAELPTVTAPAGVTTGAQASTSTTDSAQSETSKTQKASDPGQNAAAACPAGMSRKQCEDVAKQQSSAKAGTVLGTPQDCLKQFTRQQCEEMAAASKRPAGKAIQSPGDCLKVFTRDQCEAMSRAQQ
jgi:hypothetical protein